MVFPEKGTMGNDLPKLHTDSMLKEEFIALETLKHIPNPSHILEEPQ